MRCRMYWRAVIFVAVALGAWPGSHITALRFIGIGPAEAQSYSYTRQYVNGQWVIIRHAMPGVAKRRSVAKVERAANTRRTSAGAAASPAETKASAGPVMTAAVARVPQAQSDFTWEPLVPHADSDRLAKLREALQARASAMASIASSAAARPAAEPQSVSLDFRTGMKTTVFRDGASIREPFDVPAMRELASPSPAPTLLGSAK